MKPTNTSLILTFFLFLAKFGSGQDSLSTENYAFEPDKVAKEAVAKIVQYTGLMPNFVVVADKSTSTAIAYIKNNKRYIAYNPKFIEKLNNKTATDWAAVSVLAHEIGHHLSGHTLPKNSSPGNELIADKFSGFILFQMGAELHEAKAALSAIGHEMDTTKHPPQKARLMAIQEGWEDARALRNKNAYENGIPNTDALTEFVYQCTFLGDDNVYFVDEKDNIIWYNNNAKPIIIGRKQASTDNKYSWIYNYLDNFYGVDHKGKIWKETTYGSVFIVGEARLVKDKEKE
ncbi:MAG: M48 family metalloprotease [Flavobacteriales bacterium]|nr:M48 family metalloprotease [Flavobacteriales bacterium]